MAARSAARPAARPTVCRSPDRGTGSRRWSPRVEAAAGLRTGRCNAATGWCSSPGTSGSSPSSRRSARRSPGRSTAPGSSTSTRTSRSGSPTGARPRSTTWRWPGGRSPRRTSRSAATLLVAVPSTPIWRTWRDVLMIVLPLDPRGGVVHHDHVAGRAPAPRRPAPRGLAGRQQLPVRARRGGDRVQRDRDRRVVAHRQPRRPCARPWWSSVAVPLIVGWARTYAGMHHLTDVVAGIAPRRGVRARGVAAAARPAVNVAVIVLGGRPRSPGSSGFAVSASRAVALDPPGPIDRHPRVRRFLARALRPAVAPRASWSRLRSPSCFGVALVVGAAARHGRTPARASPSSTTRSPSGARARLVARPSTSSSS